MACHTIIIIELPLTTYMHNVYIYILHTTIPMLFCSASDTFSTVSSSTTFMNWSNPRSVPVTLLLALSFTIHYIHHHTDIHVTFLSMKRHRSGPAPRLPHFCVVLMLIILWYICYVYMLQKYNVLIKCVGSTSNNRICWNLKTELRTVRQKKVVEMQIINPYRPNPCNKTDNLFTNIIQQHASSPASHEHMQ